MGERARKALGKAPKLSTVRGDNAALWQGDQEACGADAQRPLGGHRSFRQSRCPVRAEPASEQWASCPWAAEITALINFASARGTLPFLPLPRCPLSAVILVQIPQVLQHSFSQVSEKQSS